MVRPIVPLRSKRAAEASRRWEERGGAIKHKHIFEKKTQIPSNLQKVNKNYYLRKTWNELTACDLCDEHVSKKLLHYVKHINTLMSPSMSAAPTADEKNGDTIKENKLLRSVARRKVSTAIRNVRFT